MTSYTICSAERVFQASSLWQKYFYSEWQRQHFCRVWCIYKQGYYIWPSASVAEMFFKKMWRGRLTLTNSKCCVNSQVHVPFSCICCSIVDQRRVVWPDSKPHICSDAKYLVDHIGHDRCQRQEPSDWFQVVRVNMPFHLQRQSLNIISKKTRYLSKIYNFSLNINNKETYTSSFCLFLLNQFFTDYRLVVLLVVGRVAVHQFQRLLTVLRMLPVEDLKQKKNANYYFDSILLKIIIHWEERISIDLCKELVDDCRST